MRIIVSRFIFLCAAFFSLIWSQAFAANIVINGEFNDTSGWDGAFFLGDGSNAGFTTIDTQTYFYAGEAASNEITQRYDLSVDEIAAAALDELAYTMSADLFGFGDENDFSVFTVKFLGAADVLLDFVQLSSTDGDPGTWPGSLTAGSGPNFQETFGEAPLGTISILFSVGALQVGTGVNSGFADNIFFEFTAGSDATPVPVPASFPLMALTICGVAVAARARRKS